jgi:hypothetical protein
MFSKSNLSDSFQQTVDFHLPKRMSNSDGKDGEKQKWKRLPQAGGMSSSHEDKAMDKTPVIEHVKSSTSELFANPEDHTSRHPFDYASQQARHTYSGISKEGETNATILSRLGQHENDFVFPRRPGEKQSKKVQRGDEGEHGWLGLGLLSRGRRGADRTGLQDPDSDKEEEEDHRDSRFSFKDVPSFAR